MQLNFCDMNKVENRRARTLAHAHAQRVSSVLEDILYFVYSIVLDDYEETSSVNHNRMFPVEKKNVNRATYEDLNRIDVVALFLNTSKGSSIFEFLKQEKKLDASITRDLYLNTEYMWSGNTESRDFDTIIKLMGIEEESSDIPQMDFIVIVVPLNKDMRKTGVLRNDTANRVSFFENICKASPEIRISNKLRHERLPKDLLYMKS